MSDVVLCFCGARMRRVESHRGPFYGCSRWPTCTGKVGMHADGRPLGFPGDAATRAARTAAHVAFDKLWRGARAPLTRDKAYRFMQRLMGLSEDEAHIGKFTKEQCEKLVALLESRRERVATVGEVARRRP